MELHALASTYVFVCRVCTQMRNNAGYTPLHLAALHNRPTAANQLTRFAPGCIGAADKRGGRAASELARRRGYTARVLHPLFFLVHISICLPLPLPLPLPLRIHGTRYRSVAGNCASCRTVFLWAQAGKYECSTLPAGAVAAP